MIRVTNTYYTPPVMEFSITHIPYTLNIQKRKKQVLKLLTIFNKRGYKYIPVEVINQVNEQPLENGMWRSIL